MKRTKILLVVMVAILSLVLCLIPVSIPVSAAILWTKETVNPVLAEGGLGSWDYGGVGAACVIQDGATYKMWYTGVDNGLVLAIGYAESTDRRTWNKYTNNPVLTKGGAGDFDEDGVGSCSVIKDGATYKMWYTGYTDAGGTKIPAIGYATSSEGTSWTKQGKVLDKGPASAWDDGGVMSPSVIKEDVNVYKMWYTGRKIDSLDAVGSIQVGYATSADGITWTKWPSNPVLSNGSAGAWDERGVGVGSVINIAGTYNMWYTGYKGYGSSGIELAIGRASSSDGISWIRAGQELTKGAGWEANGVGAPWVIYSDPWYFMWYSGVDSNFEPTLGHALSKPIGGGGGGGPGAGPDKTPPRISDVSVANITETTADISWMTSESSTSQVEYWASPGLFSPLDETKTFQHSVLLMGLTPGTLYHLKTMSKDESDNVAVSDEYTFTTLGQKAIFEVRSLEIIPLEVNPGQTATISVTVYNTGGATGSYEVTLKIDGVVAGTKAVNISAGASQKVTFAVSEDVAKTYSVNVSGLSGVLTVRVAPPSTPTPTPPSVPSPTPTPPPAPTVNWWLIGGIIVVVIAATVVIWRTLVIRGRAQ